MQPVLFDSSIYITPLRMKDNATLSLRRIAGSEPIWLSRSYSRNCTLEWPPAIAMLWRGGSVILLGPDGYWSPILVTGRKPGRCSLGLPQSTIRSK